MSLLESNTEALERLMEEVNNIPDPGSGGGASVQTDWNQTDETAPDFLKNKPFGDFPSDTLKPSANFEDMLCVADFLYKVSDAVPTLDDLSNGAIISGMGENLAITPDLIFAEGDAIIGGEDCFFVVVSVADYAIGDMIFPETGTYMSIGVLSLQPSFTIPGYTGFVEHTPIDKKYMSNAFIQYDKFLYLTSGGADPTKTFVLWVNDRGEVQVTATN